MIEIITCVCFIVLVLLAGCVAIMTAVFTDKERRKAPKDARREDAYIKIGLNCVGQEPCPRGLSFQHVVSCKGCPRLLKASIGYREDYE